MPATRLVIYLIIGATAVLPSTTQAISPPSAPDWIRQFGTSAEEKGFAVHAAADGSVYIGGQTEGPLVSPNNFSAGFIAKYSAAGDRQWIRQIDSQGSDDVRNIATDGGGNVYVAGSTGGDLGGGLGISTDAYLRKYDASGSLLWTRQVDSGEADSGTGVAIDENGNAYLSGAVLGSLDIPNAGAADAFVAKFSPTGAKLWVRQQGSAGNDASLGITTDRMGGVYVAGQTDGVLGSASFGSRDMYISKYGEDGTRLWTRQFGTSAYDVAQATSADSLGNVFIAGYTEAGSIGMYDGIVAKYDTNGNLMWSKQIGTGSFDEIFGVSTDGLGNAYVAGTTQDDIQNGVATVSAADLFVSKLDANGNVIWTKQLFTPSVEFTRSVSTNGQGSIYISGETFGNFGGPSAGMDDAFLVKLTDPAAVPEPSTMVLLMVPAVISVAARACCICHISFAGVK